MKLWIEQNFSKNLQNVQSIAHIVKDEIAHEIEPWYVVDKVKSYAVYVWTKDTDEDFGKNVFDIEADDIVFYTEHEIIPEALSAIRHIQEQLKKIEIIGK